MGSVAGIYRVAGIKKRIAYKMVLRAINQKIGYIH